MRFVHSLFGSVPFCLSIRDHLFEHEIPECFDPARASQFFWKGQEDRHFVRLYRRQDRFQLREILLQVIGQDADPKAARRIEISSIPTRRSKLATAY